MNVLVDTCIWSLAFRGSRSKNRVVRNELEALIDENRVLIVGPIRQEILSAYKDETRFEAVKMNLAFFPSSSIIENDYIVAATFHNSCRSKGVQGSHIDFLICAVTVRLKAAIFTLDKDFSFYKKHIPIHLHKPKDSRS